MREVGLGGGGGGVDAISMVAAVVVGDCGGAWRGACTLEMVAAGRGAGMR